jgi:hypothetical protein
MKKNAVIDFVYPYVKGDDKFEELRYSLRSLETYYKQPFRVVIVGDLPDWCQNVIHLPVERQVGMKENTTYDAVWKMQTVCESDQVTGIFVRMYDDVYLLKPMDFNFLAEMKALYNASKTTGWMKADGSASDTWTVQRNQTFRLLKESKQCSTIWNFETHLPEVFLKSIMGWCLKEFSVLEKRLLMTSIYNNICWQPDDADPMVVDINTNIKAGFYGIASKYSYCTVDEARIRQIIKGKYFLNHNDAGLNPALIKVIQELFPHKSKFEK